MNDIHDLSGHLECDRPAIARPILMSAIHNRYGDIVYIMLADGELISYNQLINAWHSCGHISRGDHDNDTV